MEDDAVCMRLTRCVIEALNKWKKVLHHRGLAEVLRDVLKEATDHLHPKEGELKECNQMRQEHFQTLPICQAYDAAPLTANVVDGIHAAHMWGGNLSFPLLSRAQLTRELLLLLDESSKKLVQGGEVRGVIEDGDKLL